MTERKPSRMQTIEKANPPYHLNQFPPDFGFKLGKEIVYILATRCTPDIARAEWEQIFATCINASRSSSDGGFDDVVLKNSAWSVKSIKSPKPHIQKMVKLTSRRGAPIYTYGQKRLDVEPQLVGDQILGMWNSQVDSTRARFFNLRTVVLIKSNDLSELAVFECDVPLYPPEQYVWQENEDGNLEGFEKTTKAHKFTWQIHGSELTILEPVPDDCLLINIRKPTRLNKEDMLKSLNFDKSWVTSTRRISG